MARGRASARQKKWPEKFYAVSRVTVPASNKFTLEYRCKRDLGPFAIWGPRPKNAGDVRIPLDPISLAVQGSRQRRGDP